jgi:hypothetical protein
VNYEIPKEFMKPFIVADCEECGLEHAPIRTCEEAKIFHDINNKENR